MSATVSNSGKSVKFNCFHRVTLCSIKCAWGQDLFGKKNDRNVIPFIFCHVKWFYIKMIIYSRASNLPTFFFAAFISICIYQPIVCVTRDSRICMKWANIDWWMAPMWLISLRANADFATIIAVVHSDCSTNDNQIRRNSSVDFHDVGNYINFCFVLLWNHFYMVYFGLPVQIHSLLTHSHIYHK